MNRCKYLVTALLLSSFIWSPVWSFEGFLEPAKTVEITSVETGVLQSVDVKEGDEVKAGEVLAVLDYRVFEASLKVAQAKKDSSATIISAEAEWDIAKEKLVQFERLYAAGNARKDEVVRAQLEEKIAAARLTHSREQKAILELEYERIQTQIERHFIRSPVDGIVVDIARDIGELVSISQGPFIRLVDVRNLRFVTNLPQHDAQSIKTGDGVIIELNQQETELEGVVEFISEVIDPTSNTAKVTVMIEDPGGIKSGNIGRLKIKQKADSQ